MGIMKYNDDIQGMIYYATQNITTNPNWTQVGSSYKQIVNNTDGSFYGVNFFYGVNLNMMYYHSSFNSGGVQMPGTLSQIYCKNGYRY